MAAAYELLNHEIMHVSNVLWHDRRYVFVQHVAFLVLEQLTEGTRYVLYSAEISLAYRYEYHCTMFHEDVILLLYSLEQRRRIH